MSLPWGPGVRVVTEHATGLVAVDKPAGIRSHPNGTGVDEQAILRAPYDEAGEAYVVDGQPLFLLHRLDGPTSGLVLLCRDAALARDLKEQFARHTVNKVYRALVKGRPARVNDVWRDRLRTERRGGMVRTYVGGIEPAEVEVTLLRSTDKPPLLSLLELRPRTGRSHQLRVQAASRHLPIVGDATYGDFAANRDLAKRLKARRLFLHALSIEVELPGAKGPFRAETVLPPEFEAPFGARAS